MKNIQSYNWDRLYANGRDFTAVDTASVSKLAGLVEDGTNKTFLDIGCGTGQLVRDMYHRGFSAIGIDSSKVAIKIAKESTTYLDKDINFCVTDIFNLHGDKYSLITCKNVIAFIDNRDKFYVSVKNRMHDKSVFVIITPDIDKLPAEKQDIAIPHEVLAEELSKQFAKVERITVKNAFWYICRL